MRRYAWRDLIRNPRRTLTAVVGVILGVGLFSSVLFFIDGSGAAMTKRALAPLALDMQRVLGTPLDGGLRLDEQISTPGSIGRGAKTTITLQVKNTGAQPANEVVVNDEPPVPLAYVAGTTTIGGRPLPGTAGQNPLAQGLARSGLNIGTVPAGHTVRLSYVARATRPVPDAASLQLAGTISSRGNLVPTTANAPPPPTLAELQGKIAAIPGVAAVDGLSFVDLPPGSLRAGGAAVKGPIRVFGFDRRYQQHYPSIHLVHGAFGQGSSVLSAEASRALGATPGSQVELSVPGRPGPLSLPVGGVADLSQAKPLFYSRNSTKLEDFLYVPNSVVVSPRTFRDSILPAYRAASATRGDLIKSLPLEEVDVAVDRSRLNSNPATALAQTTAVAAAVNRISPGQDYLIDNISNTLQVARDDAGVGKRMFLFLGLPGVLLAAFLASYSAGILAGAERRERANLRLRGADGGHLRRILLYKTLALAGAGSALGTALGFLSVWAILGGSALFEASASQLATSALIGAVGGMLVTGLTMYVPGRRSLSREIGQERREIAATAVPAWRRWRLDYALLAAAAIAVLVAMRTGAFDPPASSVSSGQAVSLPSRLLIAPLMVWFGGTLIAVRLFQGTAALTPLPSPPRFGPLIRGTVARSLKRRSWPAATAIIAVGLVIAFGVNLAMFSATYESTKAADAGFIVGSDLRVTPSALSGRTHPPGYAAQLRIGGVAAVTPAVFKLENSVLIGSDNQDRKNLAAIDPRGFRGVATLPDSFFVGNSAAEAMAALGADPQGLLVSDQSAADLGISTGDSVKVLLARGTKSQILEPFHVVGQFKHFPGFPEGVDLVANLGYYAASTHLNRADFFLAQATDNGPAGLARATAALQSGPGQADALNIESIATALGKDQSSLTALNVHGLIDLGRLYALLIGAAAIAIFVFGLMLQRRREYVTLRAQGMRTREVQALILSETAVVAICGLAAGLAVGTGMALLLVHTLRPLFILDPILTFPIAEIARLAAVAMTSTLAAAFAASLLLRRLRPTEILRDSQ